MGVHAHAPVVATASAGNLLALWNTSGASPSSFPPLSPPLFLLSLRLCPASHPLPALSLRQPRRANFVCSRRGGDGGVGGRFSRGVKGGGGTGWGWGVRAGQLLGSVRHHEGFLGQRFGYFTPRPPPPCTPSSTP